MNRHRRPFWLCALPLLVLSCAAEAAPGSGLCEHPDVLRVRKGDCRSAPALYRDHGTVTNTEIAQVKTRVINHNSALDDVIEDVYEYFVRLPDGKLVRIEERSWLMYWRSAQNWSVYPRIASNLGLSASQVDESVIYDKFIER